MAEQGDRDPPTGEGVAVEVPPPQDVTAPEDLALAAGFPGADREQWRELVAAVLHKSGRRDLPTPVEAALVSMVEGSLQVAPLYDPADGVVSARGVGVPGLPPFVRGSQPGSPSPGWDVRARHAHPDVSVTVQAITDDLDNGVTSLWLVLGPGAIPAGAIREVLAEVDLEVAPVVLQAGPGTRTAAEAFLDLARSSGIDAESVRANLGADPFGETLRTGAEPDLSVAVDLAGRCRTDFPSMRAVVIDATAVHEAGAGVVEQLGYAMAAGVAVLRALTDAGLDIDSAVAALDFRYSASADQFLTIAALRAARRLWNRIGEVCGASASVRGQRQHVVTSSVMMTKRDPWVNMLRTTVACFAAGVGGADAVTVLPFDSELGLPDSFARRIARNTHALLMEEGHIARVLDPAGGSWYVESLTDQVADNAWQWFTEIERAGGLAQALATGLVADRIGSVWAARKDRLADRSEAITGVSEFPNLTESLPLRDPYPSDPSAAEHPIMAVVRAAEDFEALRDRVDAELGETGSRPAVFLVRLGSLASSSRRASFAENLFQAAGLETPSNGSDEGDDAAIVAAMRKSGTCVVCLCGTDKAYAQRAPALVEKLIDAGATQVWMAGQPHSAGSGQDGQESAPGADLDRIDGHIFTGCDALMVLNTVLEGLGLGKDGGGSP